MAGEQTGDLFVSFIYFHKMQGFYDTDRIVNVMLMTQKTFTPKACSAILSITMREATLSMLCHYSECQAFCLHDVKLNVLMLSFSPQYKLR